MKYPPLPHTLAAAQSWSPSLALCDITQASVPLPSNVLQSEPSHLIRMEFYLYVIVIWIIIN